MNLLDLVVTISADDQATSKVSSISEGMITKGVAAGNLIAKGIEVGVQAITQAVSALVDFTAQSVETGMEFDKSMSQVAATMGLTTDEIGDLRDTALEMGSSTSFSATQAAEALNYMALAGYDSETAIEMLPNVLNLAAAGAMDLGAASDMVTDSQTALGLSLEETATMVDQMAKASSKSNTSVSQLGDAILTVGGTAKNLAGGTTELNTVLGLLADNGIKGAEAGTHLRNIMLSLSSPTDKAAAQLKALGVEAFDADGNLRPLEDTFLDLQGALDGMTQEDRTQALSTIFNKTDLSSVNALLSTSADRWDELGAAIVDAGGAAEQMANTQLDNLAGDMTLMQSAIEGTQIAISDLLTPSLRELAGAAGESFGAIAESLRNGDIEGAATSLGQLVANLGTMIISHIPQILDAGLKLFLGFIEGFAKGLPQMIPAIVSMISGLVQTLISNIPLLVKAAVQLAIGLAMGLVQAIPEIVKAIPEIIMAIIEALVELAPAVVEAFVAMFEGIDLGEALGNILTSIVEWFGGLFEQLATFGAELLTNLGNWLAQLPEQIGATLLAIIEAVGDWIVEMATNAAEAGSQFVENVVKFITELPGKIAEFLANIISNVVEWVADMASDAQEAGSQFLTNVVNFISQLPGQIAGFLASIISSVAGWVSDMIDKAVEAGSEFLSSVQQGFENVVSFFAELPGRIIGAIGDAGSMLWDVGCNIMNGLAGGIQSMVGGLIDTVGGAINSVIDGAKSLLGIASPSKVFKQIGKFTMQGLDVGIEDNMGEPLRTMEEMAESINDIGSGIGANWDIEGTVKSVNKLAHSGLKGAKAQPEAAKAERVERNFEFNVTVNNDGEARGAGRAIGEALYTEFARLERNALYA